MANLKKILLVFSVFSFLISTVNAGTFIFEDNEAKDIIDTSQGANYVQEIIFPTDNFFSSFPSLTGNGSINITYDYKQTFILSDDLFFQYDNDDNFTRINLTLRWYINDAGVINTTDIKQYEITMDEIHTYSFVISPENENEKVEMYLDYPADEGATIEQFGITRRKSIPELAEPFVSAVTDLIYINIGIWKVLYYTLILSLILLTIGAILGLSFLLITTAKKIREEKERR